MMSPRIVLLEDDHRIHARERGENFGSLVLRRDRPQRPLDGADRSIRIDAHDERIAFAACRLEVPDVAGVQEVEHAVGEHDLVALVSQVLDERDRLCRDMTFVRTSWILTTELVRFSAVSRSGRMSRCAAGGRCRLPSSAT